MQDPENYFSTILTAFIGGAVTWVGRWLFDWNKEKKEVQKSEVELSAQIAAMWREQSQELETRLKAVQDKLDTVLGKLDVSDSENRELKRKNKSLENKVTELEKVVVRLTKRVTDSERHGE